MCYLGCKGIRLIQDIINYSLIIVDMNPELQGFIKSYKILITTSGGVRVGLKFTNLCQVIREISDI